MAQICVSNLTFAYEGSFENLFESVSFCLDTDWKLGFIGRNGKGKTTFLKLLMGELPHQGTITRPVPFAYFPYSVKAEWMSLQTLDVLSHMEPDYAFWKLCREMTLLNLNEEVLYRPFCTLSPGERTKVMLSILFSHDHAFLLIDEPTNHLDMPNRALVQAYLAQKQGFILVSHDRELLDGCIDHVLVLNRQTVTLERGNFSSWYKNKQMRDTFEETEYEKKKQQIKKLEQHIKQTASWAACSEQRKIGFDPIKEHDRSIASRASIGAKTKRMETQKKNTEHRQQKAIQEQKSLLKDIEHPAEIKLIALHPAKEQLIFCRNLTLCYGCHEVISTLCFELNRGDRLLLHGRNGRGKSSIFKALLRHPSVTVLGSQSMPLFGGSGHPAEPELTVKSDVFTIPNGLMISYVNQDTSFLHGDLIQYIRNLKLDQSHFLAILRQLDFERTQFDKPIEQYSEGQKKKLLIAGSLLSQAHLYVWDEPLNSIDVFSRMQIERLIEVYQPTMLLVEHDKQFETRIATKILDLDVLP